MTPTSGALVAAAAVVAAVMTLAGSPTTGRVARRRARLLASAQLDRADLGRGGDPGLALIQRLVVTMVGGLHLARLDRGRRSRRADRAVPILLESVARELRSGASLVGAVTVATRELEARVASADPAVGVLATSLARGVPLSVAVPTWIGPEPSASRHLAGTALLVAGDTGGATALVIDGVADTLRDRVALEREVAALSSQARASAVLLVVAPVVVAVLAAMADERIAAFLLSTPLGWSCILLGLLLDLAGAAWMSFTIGRST